jgi:hypothetical protein
MKNEKKGSRKKEKERKVKPKTFLAALSHVYPQGI